MQFSLGLSLEKRAKLGFVSLQREADTLTPLYLIEVFLNANDATPHEELAHWLGTTSNVRRNSDTNVTPQRETGERSCGYFPQYFDRKTGSPFENHRISHCGEWIYSPSLLMNSQKGIREKQLKHETTIRNKVACNLLNQLRVACRCTTRLWLGGVETNGTFLARKIKMTEGIWICLDRCVVSKQPQSASINKAVTSFEC